MTFVIDAPPSPPRRRGFRAGALRDPGGPMNLMLSELTPDRFGGGFGRGNAVLLLPAVLQF